MHNITKVVYNEQQDQLGLMIDGLLIVFSSEPKIYQVFTNKKWTVIGEL